MREINELIWHCTATPEGRVTTVAEIDQWHKARGWSGIGYHFVVYLDGTVHVGRPVANIGAHVEGHNTGTIGCVYVGGTDKQGKPKDTRTAAQKTAMLELTKQLVAKYGIKKISGHYEYAAKACPCFKPKDEYALVLGGKPTTAPVGIPGPTPDERLRWLQSLLKTLNYDLGMVDGIMGPKTETAIFKFQHDNKLEATGTFDAPTVAKLRFLAEAALNKTPAKVVVTEVGNTVTVSSSPAVTNKSLAAVSLLVGVATALVTHNYDGLIGVLLK